MFSILHQVCAVHCFPLKVCPYKSAKIYGPNFDLTFSYPNLNDVENKNASRLFFHKQINIFTAGEITRKQNLLAGDIVLNAHK